MTRLGSMVSFYPATGDVEPLAIENPIPDHAVEIMEFPHRGDDLFVQAAMASGIGRVRWQHVQGISEEKVKMFEKHFGITEVFAGNAKTDKPRPKTGQRAKIQGLHLAPHYYPNFLNVMEADAEGRLIEVPKERFNRFNGVTKSDVVPQVNEPGARRIDEDALLDFCKGSSPYCRATCLVLSGNHPSSPEAVFKKMRLTYALLSDPEMFVALLHKHLRAMAISARRSNLDAVVRLNMLSDIPWYVVCPELFEAHGPDGSGGRIFFYDYTKLEFWRSEEYQRVAPLLDLTYSFSGSNPKRCAEALRNGVRVAAAFASENPQRRATFAQRTSFQEILGSGLVDEHGRIGLFEGRWLIVDGDVSDFRIDDPQGCIVALNFKEPSVTPGEAPAEGAKMRRSRGKLKPPMYVPHLKEWLPKSREKFAVPVPESERSEAYLKARNLRSEGRPLWPQVFGEDRYTIALNQLSMEQLIDLAGTFRRVLNKSGHDEAIEAVQRKAGRMIKFKANVSDDIVPLRRNLHDHDAMYPVMHENPDDSEGEFDRGEDPSSPVTEQTSMPMRFVGDTNILIGPHVPTVLRD